MKQSLQKLVVLLLVSGAAGCSLQEIRGENKFGPEYRRSGSSNTHVTRWTAPAAIRVGMVNIRVHRLEVSIGSRIRGLDILADSKNVCSLCIAMLPPRAKVPSVLHGPVFETFQFLVIMPEITGNGHKRGVAKF